MVGPCPRQNRVVARRFPAFRPRTISPPRALSARQGTHPWAALLKPRIGFPPPASPLSAMRRLACAPFNQQDGDPATSPARAAETLFMTTKKMLIDAAHPEETRVVVVDGNRVEE